MNLGRTWRIKERASFNLRMEFTNVFNRSMGTIAIVNLSPRNGTLVGRFTF
jgi:hypothetical protein